MGNLAWSIDGQALREVFCQAGNVVDARVIKERNSGRSRGFGFVTFESDEDAERAVDMLNGQDLEGRPLRIDYAIQREDSSTTSPEE